MTGVDWDAVRVSALVGLGLFLAATIAAITLAGLVEGWLDQREQRKKNRKDQ